MISLDDALRNVIRLGLDTAPFIYFIERNPAYVDMMREIFQRVNTGAIQSFSSAVTLTEVLVQPKRTSNPVLEQEYRDLLLNGRNFTLVPIGAVVAESAADLRARYALRTPDALQVAAALYAGCDTFLTNDMGLRRVTEIQVLVLDELTL